MPDTQDLLKRLASEEVEILREAAFEAGEQACEACVPRLAGLLGSRNLGVQEAADHALRKIGGRKTVQAVIPLLRSEEAPERNMAMDILREVGGQDFESLEALMHDNDPDVRIFTADILGSTDNSSAVKPLCEALLKDPEENVRYQAAVSLGELGRSEAASCLNSALSDSEWVQFAVIEALSKIRDESSVGALVKAMGKSSDLVASMIVDALGEMGNVKAVSMLLARLDDSPAALRNKILKAVLSILGGRSLTLLSQDERDKIRQYLLAALSDSDADIRDAAVEGLGWLGDDQAAAAVVDVAAGIDFEHDAERYDLAVGSLARMARTAALETALREGSWLKARAAARALGRIGGAEAEKALTSSFHAGDRDLQREMSSALAAVGGDEAERFFITLLDEHEDGSVLKDALAFLGRRRAGEEVQEKIFGFLGHPYDDVKEAALDACVETGGPAMRERFRELFASREPMDRLMAVYVLGKLGVRENIDELKVALEDEVPDIRKVALEAFGTQCADLPEWLPLLVARLDDENREVRLAVVELMGSCGTGEAGRHLLQAMRDDDDWVRVRAVEASGAMRMREAVPELVELMGDQNRLVAIKAVEALGEIGGRTAFKALLDVLGSEDYELASAAESSVAKIQVREESE